LKIQFFSDVSEEIVASTFTVAQDELSTLMCSKPFGSICDYTPIIFQKTWFFHQHYC